MGNCCGRVFEPLVDRRGPKAWGDWYRGQVDLEGLQ